MKRIIPEEEKMRIVRIVKNGTPVNVVCRQEGVSRSALYEWIKLYKSRTRWGSKKTINLKQVYQMERRLATLEEEVQIFTISARKTPKRPGMTPKTIFCVRWYRNILRKAKNGSVHPKLR